MSDLSQLLLYIPGIVIFLVGTGQLRGWLRRRRPDSSTVGTVVNGVHVVKRDKKDREIYNYYNVMAEYTDAHTQHKVRQSFKSPSEYAKGQQVRIYWGDGAEKATLSEKENEALFHPLVMSAGGALLILLAMFENQKKEVPAMLCLAAVLTGAGVSLLWNYISLKKKKLQPLEAEIIEIYTRQISRETKILKGSKFTYYPVVRYMIDGKENIRRCNINSGSQNSFKTGETMTLYRDPQTGAVMERHPQTVMAVAGVVLAAAGILAGLSILSVVL